MQENEILLELKSLHFEYEQKKVLQGLSFRLKKCSRTALVGPSGSGKSTLLKLIAGELVPHKGQIHFAGQPYETIRNPRLSSVPGVVLMNQEWSLSPDFSVEESLLASARHLAPSVAQRKIGSLLRVLELNGLRKQRVRSLSGGQRQRVALAACLISNAQLLLLDEPFSQIDYHLKQQLLLKLNEFIQDKAVIMVGHEPADLLDFANDMMILDKGRIVSKGPGIELYRNPKDLRRAELLGKINLWEDKSFYRPDQLELVRKDGPFAVQKIIPSAGGDVALLNDEQGKSVWVALGDVETRLGECWSIGIKKADPKESA